VQVPPYRLDECERRIIESALLAPRFGWEGEDKYSDLAAKAAALLYALSKSQACPDGNKRVALILVVEFLALNGSTIDVDPDTLADMILETAAADPATREDVVAALTERLRPLTEPLTEDE
jgi:death-on-curing protein